MNQILLQQVGRQAQFAAAKVEQAQVAHMFWCVGLKDMQVFDGGDRGGPVFALEVDAAQVEQQSGGVESDNGSGGSSAAAWLLAGLGLAVVAGGVWAASRMRKRA